MTHTPTPTSANEPDRRWPRWRYLTPLAILLVLWLLVAAALFQPVSNWLHGEESYDQAAVQEWLEEARGFRETLPEMIDPYVMAFHRLADASRRAEELKERELSDPEREAAALELENAKHEELFKRDAIEWHLAGLGNPSTKMYNGQLILFPTVYRMQIRFERQADGQTPLPITWDSGLPVHSTQYRELALRLPSGAVADVKYQLHAYNRRQQNEQEQQKRGRQLAFLALAATILVTAWVLIVQGRERERESQRLRAREQVTEAERLLLQEENRHAETERKLLEQRLATQAAEQKTLELRSQLYASISIMAGSYAHNIKNLLVRPNDLLHRCLEADSLSSEQTTMLHEVQQTLGTVTERLQQILRTVRRDPGRAEKTRLDLNAMLRDIEHTWRELARDKWKLEVVAEPSEAGPLCIAGDVSHLQQAIENLLFNARDATFEMRGHLRDEARSAPGLDDRQRKQALIAAAAWRGQVILRTRREDDAVILEVSDNGAGMTEAVRRRCTETHFSTKRDNAIYEGHSTGMGLGLSFVVTILEHHDATLEIDSQPLHGTTFRVRFPIAEHAKHLAEG
jgi:signal transduction histidine kinase